jgi:phage terminase large subunit GpA-like protein
MNAATTPDSIPMPEAVARVFTPPPRMTVTEWADAHRILHPKYTADPGPYQSSRTPWAREIQDAFADGNVSQIVIKKCARVSGSEAMLNMLFYAACCYPSPSMYVFPTLPLAKEEATGRFRDTVLACPEWKKQIPHKGWSSAEKMEFRRAHVYFAAMAAPATLINRTACNIFLDEIDNAMSQATRLGNSLDMALERVTTFGDRAKQVYCSTPDMEDGPICSLWKATDRREWCVPCPHCGMYQVLEFEQLKLKPEYAECRDLKLLQATDCVDCVCRHCGERVSEATKRWMNSRGMWKPAALEIAEPLPVDDPEIVRAAQIVGDGRWKPRMEGTPEITRNVGFWLQGLVSPWRPWRKIIAKLFETRHDRDKFKVFWNSWLGRGWRDVVQATTADHLRTKAATGLEPEVVPGEAQVLLMSVDVQGDHFWWVMRAWGPQERSWLVDYGRAETWDELRMLSARQYPHLEREDLISTSYMGIDNRYRRDEVIEFARHPGVLMLAGVPRSNYMTRAQKIEYTTTQKKGISKPIVEPHSVMQHNCNSHAFRDKLHRLIGVPDGTVYGHWHLNRGVLDDYVSHLTAERKIREKKSGRYVEVWKPTSEHRANHLLDCEVMQIQLVHILRINTMEPKQ